MNQKILKSTPRGSVAIIWNLANQKPRVVRVLISKPGLPTEERVNELYPASTVSSCAEIDQLAMEIKGYFEGEDIPFSLEMIDLESCGRFQQRVLRAEHQIPRGRVSTYKLIAEHLGKPGGARAVGNGLATNPYPIIIPCHRAVRSDGHLGGYQGGLEMKRSLLEMEGIQFDARGKVVCNRFFYQK